MEKDELKKHYSKLYGVFFQYCFEAGLLYKKANCYSVRGIEITDDYDYEDYIEHYIDSKEELDEGVYSVVLQFYKDLDYHVTTFKNISTVVDEYLEDILKEYKEYYYTKEQEFTKKIPNADELISNLEGMNLYMLLYSALYTATIFLEAVKKHFFDKDFKKLEIWCDSGVRDSIEYVRPDIILVDELENFLAVGDLKAPRNLLNNLRRGEIFNESMNLITVDDGRFLEKLHIPKIISTSHFVQIGITHNKLFKLLKYAEKLRVQKIYWITPLRIYYYNKKNILEEELLKFHKELYNSLSENKNFKVNKRFSFLDYKNHLCEGDYHLRKENGKVIINNDIIGEEAKYDFKVKKKPYRVYLDNATLLLSRGFHRFKFCELLGGTDDIIINASGQGVGKNAVLKDYLKTTNAKMLLITPRKIIINEMFEKLNGLKRDNGELLKVEKCYRDEKNVFKTINGIYAFKPHNVENSSDKFFKLVSEDCDVILTTSQTLRFILTKINQMRDIIKNKNDLNDKKLLKNVLDRRKFDINEMLAYKKFFQYFDLIVVDEYSANPDDAKSAVFELIISLNELKKVFPNEKFAKIVITDASLTDLDGFVNQIQKFVEEYANGERVFYDKITMDIKSKKDRNYITIPRNEIVIENDKIIVRGVLLNDYLKGKDDIAIIKNNITKNTKLQYYYNKFKVDNLSVSAFKVYFKLPLSLYVHVNEVEADKKKDLLEEYANKIIECCKNVLKDGFDKKIQNGKVVFYCDNIVLCDILERKLIDMYGDKNKDLFVVLHSQTDAERVTEKLKNKNINIIGTSSLAYGISLEKHDILFIIPPLPEFGWESVFYKDIRNIEKIRQVINRLRGSDIKRGVYINVLDFVFCNFVFCNGDENINRKKNFRYYDIKSTFENVILSDDVVIKPQCVYLPLKTWDDLLFSNTCKNYKTKFEYTLLDSYTFAVEFFAQIRSVLLQCGFKVYDFVSVNVKDLSILPNLYLVTSPMLTPFQANNIKLFAGYSVVGGIDNLKKLVNYCLTTLNECHENSNYKTPRGIGLLTYVILNELNVEECEDGDIRINLDGKIKSYKKSEIYRIIDESFKKKGLSEDKFVNDILSKVYQRVLKDCDIMVIYLFNALFNDKDVVSELYPFIQALTPPLLNVDVGNCINKRVVKLFIEDKDIDESKRGIGIITTHPLLLQNNNDNVPKLIKKICLAHCICENQLPIPRLNKFI